MTIVAIISGAIVAIIFVGALVSIFTDMMCRARRHGGLKMQKKKNWKYR